MALTEEEKEYIIAEAVRILRDENREDLVKILHEKLEEEQAYRAVSEGDLDRKKLDGIVWAVTRTLLQRGQELKQERDTRIEPT
jgi:hypothetical protein